MINNNNFSIFFGDSSTSPISIHEYKSEILSDKECLKSKIKMANDVSREAYFLHQTHGINGLVVDNQNRKSIEILEYEGDYLITNTKNIAIGILTADCLPIVFYDTINNIAAIAHAGWRGTVKNIAQITFEKMQKDFNTNIKTTQIFFGPSAKSCCYEVSKDFDQNLNNPKLSSQAFIKQNNQCFFDMPLYNKLLLGSLGATNIDSSYNNCTICNPNFCSFRRQKEKSGLQMSVIMLK